MTDKAIRVDSIKSIPEDSWKKLAEKKVYFGHQSVGYNIVEGLEAIMKENPQIKLDIVKIDKPAELSGPMFAHSTLGENNDPQSKINAFADYIEKGIGNNADVAFFKFCYLDIHANTDIDKAFSDYKNTMDRLKKEYPKTRFIHVTVPLTTSGLTIKTLIKKIIGKPDNNIKRNQFNDKMLKEYGGKDPLFYLSDVESTYPDGRRSSFTIKGNVYYSLVPEYTDDGGHLNEKGKKVVAKELMLFLSGLMKD